MKRRRGLTNYRASRAFDIFRKCFNVKALEDGLTIKHSKTIYYCIDGSDNWIELAPDTESIEINAGHIFSIKAELVPSETEGIGTMFMNKKCNIYGKIFSLIFGEENAGKTSNNVSHLFYKLFEGNTGIVNANELDIPMSFIGMYGCGSMFKGCTSLETAPELYNVTTYSTGACYSMYEGCTSLKKTPKIYSTQLAISVYHSMFKGCTSLESASELSVSYLQNACYASMFEGCTSLKNARLWSNYSSVSAKESCFEAMFRGCTSLETAPYLRFSLAKSCYESMFEGCTSLKTAPDLAQTSLVEDCYKNMFNGCSNLNYVNALFKTTPTGETTNWLLNVATTGTFVKNADAEWNITGPNGIPEGWVIISREQSDSSWQNTTNFNFTGNEYIFTDIDLRDSSYYIETNFTQTSTELDKFKTVFNVVSYDNVSLALKYSNRTSSDVIGYADYWNGNTAKELKGVYSNTQTVIFNNEGVTMNETLFAATGSSSNYPMNLMIGNEYIADENGGISTLGTDNAWVGTINYITIKDVNGNTIYDLVPVTKTQNSGQIIYGFKDKVSNKVYECSYINEPPIESLEYIPFNGSQYILTDINVNTPPYYLEVKFEDLDDTLDKYRPIFGVISAQADQPDPNSGAYTSCYLSCSYSNSESTSIFGYAVPWNVNNSSTALTCTYSNLKTIEFTPDGISIDGETFSLPAEIRSSEKPMNLMLGNVYYANSDGSISNFKYNSSNGWLGNIYYVIIKDSSGNIIHELRPEKTSIRQYTFRDVITDKVYYMKNR